MAETGPPRRASRPARRERAQLLIGEAQLLREAGLTDRDILSLVQVVAYYNMSTRMFESLSTVDP